MMTIYRWEYGMLSTAGILALERLLYSLFVSEGSRSHWRKRMGELLHHFIGWNKMESESGWIYRPFERVHTGTTTAIV